MMSVSSFFPNPTNAGSQIHIYTSTEAKLTIEIYDMIGQMLERNELYAPAGNSLYGINTSKLTAGNYKAVIRSANNTFINNLIIIR